MGFVLNGAHLYLGLAFFRISGLQPRAQGQCRRTLYGLRPVGLLPGNTPKV